TAHSLQVGRCRGRGRRGRRAGPPARARARRRKDDRALKPRSLALTRSQRARRSLENAPAVSSRLRDLVLATAPFARALQQLTDAALLATQRVEHAQRLVDGEPAPEVVERRAQLRRWLRVRIGRVRRIARRLLGLSGVLTGLRRRARVRLTTRPRRGRARIRAAGLSLSRTGLRARLPRP